MPKKIAIKRLRSSDLTFFQSYLDRHPDSSQQKGFNLDRKVVETTFFPALADVVDSSSEKRALVSLTVHGPGAAPAHYLARKILKQEKNWRLNGETIHDPEAERYRPLQPDDFAIMEFGGLTAPDRVKIVLISAANAQDQALHSAITTQLSFTSMRVISEEEIEQLISVAGPILEHPIRDWSDKGLVEDAALGGRESLEKLLRRRASRGMSLAEMQTAKKSADRNGAWGEQLLNHYFTSSTPQVCLRHTWVSQVNAISPYDFEIEVGDGIFRHVDAKSTSGSFDQPIHISTSEMAHACRGPVAYDLYRLFEVTENTAQLRVCKGIGPALLPVLQKLSELPAGVVPDSLSFPPSFFKFDLKSVSIRFS